MDLYKKLSIFASEHNFTNKGPLCVALIVTRIAQKKGLPLDHLSLLTEKSGQVRGLGKAGVQRILSEHNIDRILASEGGRTSRGSIGNMQDYVKFLNEESQKLDLDMVEAWWIERVREFFSSMPLTWKLDSGGSIRSGFTSLLAEATKRQTETKGATTVGTVLQHLVGAKLKVLLPQSRLEHHGASVADAPTERGGDFEVGDTVIHVTTAPSRALIAKCETNLHKNLRPLIISTLQGVAFARSLAGESTLEHRIDVLDIEQFMVGNLAEWTEFDSSQRTATLENLVNAYNDIVDRCETDPSLRIVLA